VTAALAPRVPEGIVIVSESSLLTDDDVSRALAAGADAVLVGTMLLQADDPAARLTALTQLQTAKA
jgi:indole-3-glycerol phosphate synthase